MAKPKDQFKASTKGVLWDPTFLTASKAANKANEKEWKRIKDGMKPKTPEPTGEQLAMEARQREQSALLDREENLRRKRLFSGMRGLRVFRGSIASRGGAGRGAAGGSASQAGGPAAPANIPVDFGVPSVFGAY